MKKKLFLILIFLFFSSLEASENLKFYINNGIKNNLGLNAERKKFETAKQEKIYLEVNFYQV